MNEAHDLRIDVTVAAAYVATERIQAALVELHEALKEAHTSEVEGFEIQQVDGRRLMPGGIGGGAGADLNLRAPRPTSSSFSWGVSPIGNLTEGLSWGELNPEL